MWVNGKDSLKLTYETESGLQSFSYKGKFKKNYFEIYFSKKLIPIPFLFFVKDFDRVRIGHNKNSDLLIQHYDDHLGWILVMAAGGTNEDEYSFQNIHNYKELKPSKFNGKWGYTDSLQNIAIKPQYDSVEFFKNGLSRVKKNGKWGLLNENGIELTPIKYDTIYAFNQYDMAKAISNNKKGYVDINGQEIIPLIYNEIYFSSNDLIKITLNHKEGYLNHQGQEVIPPIYDVIGYFADSLSIVVCSENRKYGYRTMTDVISPPIFDKVSEKFSTDLTDICKYSWRNKIPFAKVIYQGKPYLLDEKGYVYQYQCLKNIRKEFIILEDSKIKATDLQNGLSDP
ncbi:MAG: WG repeat-containing protein [Candidatus Azobacteroides sp.]|nr:WG repeat-containing protein [Candidatus Azobacteroides sp.]